MSSYWVRINGVSHFDQDLYDTNHLISITSDDKIFGELLLSMTQYPGAYLVNPTPEESIEICDELRSRFKPSHQLRMITFQFDPDYSKCALRLGAFGTWGINESNARKYFIDVEGIFGDGLKGDKIVCFESIGAKRQLPFHLSRIEKNR